MSAYVYFDSNYPQLFADFDRATRTFNEFYFTVLYTRELGHILPNSNSSFVYGGILQSLCANQAECVRDLAILTQKFNSPRYVNNVVVVGYLYKRGKIHVVMGHII